MPIVLAVSDLVAVRPGLIFWTLVTFILAAVNLVIGELAPKRLGMQFARQ